MGVKRKVKAKIIDDYDLQELFDEFIDGKTAQNVSKATIRSYTLSFQRFYLFLGDRTKTSDITEKTIYAFIHRLQEEMVKPTSINHYLREIRAFLYWCMKSDLIKPEFQVTLVKEQEEIKETYTDEELKVMTTKPLKTSSFVEWRTWAIINWILATGNRAETVCNIKLGDLNFNKYEITLQHTKNKKSQIIPMSRELKFVVQEYIKMFRGEASNDEYLFCNIGAEKLTTNALKHSLRDYNLSRGVNKTSAHALRHTFAKNWILNTGDVFRLQKLLGHSTLEMTRKYVNMFSDDLKDNFENYNPLDRLKRTQPRRQTVKRTDK